jgi:meiotic recombination protein SPO11
MDSDLLSEILSDHHPALIGSLHSNLPYNSLTDEEHTLDHGEFKGRDAVVPPRRSHANEAGAVISKIEDIFEAIADCILSEKKEVTIQLKTRKKTGKQDQSSNSKAKPACSEADVRTIRYPSMKPQEAWKFSE